MENKISIEIPRDVASQVNQKIKELSDLLKPYLVALTSEQRQNLPKMGDKTLSFVEKGINYCEINPDFAPRYLDVNELKKDFDAYQTLAPVLRQLKAITSNMDDTLLLCGSEAYIASLSYYNSVKEAARRNATDAKTIALDLKARFVLSNTTKSGEGKE